MPLKLKQARKASQRSKDLINGYVRLQYTNSTIPIVINYVCLSYYLMKEKFGKHGKSLEVLSSNVNANKCDMVGGIANCDEAQNAWSLLILIQADIGI